MVKVKVIDIHIVFHLLSTVCWHLLKTFVSLPTRNKFRANLPKQQKKFFKVKVAGLS